MFGDDFAHPQADKSYALMDTIIHRLQDEPNLVIKYSTVHDYIEGVKADAREMSIEWPVHTEDLFPHFTDMTEYWSGYYTSSPFIKKTIRQYAAYTNANSFIHSLAALGDAQRRHYITDTESLYKDLTVNFHHDAITGTHMPAV